ncbi:hypothetical protein Hamer_G027411 [Homarus americanus]|uniref:Uncharacterized protein n=1 Tax=Homarus americanus TaxID=6706 RepID=A0A8J5KHU1_HOMAM|nr:hypothetical protein Hamer_G027411 [Homarus americanus]
MSLGGRPPRTMLIFKRGAPFFDTLVTPENLSPGHCSIIVGFLDYFIGLCTIFSESEANSDGAALLDTSLRVEWRLTPLSRWAGVHTHAKMHYGRSAPQILAKLAQ